MDLCLKLLLLFSPSPSVIWAAACPPPKVILMADQSNMQGKCYVQKTLCGEHLLGILWERAHSDPEEYSTLEVTRGQGYSTKVAERQGHHRRLLRRRS